MKRCLVLVVTAACGDNHAGPDGHLLSDLGLYEDMADKVIAPEAIALRPAYPLWSDGAQKRRWMILPPGSVIDSSDMNHWELPIGTKLFKEFVVDGRRVETRVIERRGDADYRFTPYLWEPDESDAVATPEGATDVLGTTHDIPSKDTCGSCHEGERGRALGVSAVQLSAMLDELPLSQRPEQRFPIQSPALGVLHANCGHCHNDEEGSAKQIQLQLQLSTLDTTVPIADTRPYRSMVGVPLANWSTDTIKVRVVPGDPAASAIYYRMSKRATTEQMPPLATEIVDDEALDTVADWIRSL